MTTAAPLAGVTVVELGHSVAAPFATLILAQLGAEIIKIEAPGTGDPARDWGPPFRGECSVLFDALNRGKRSAKVDLKDPHQKDQLVSFICSKADVVIQNLRPGVVKRLGLDADELLKAKPSLIYCNLSAFGRTGPMKSQPGYDPLMQAFGGLMSVTGEPGRPPVRVGVSMVDMGAGLWSVIGILSALAELRGANDNGLGGVIDTSLYETALSWMSIPLATYLSAEQVMCKQGSGAAQIAPYQAFETADGYLMIAVGNDNLFSHFAQALGHPEWETDPRFQSNSKRVENITALLDILIPAFQSETTDTWAAVLDHAGVPNAPLQNSAEVANAEQTKALKIIQKVTENDPGCVGIPISFNNHRPICTQPTPTLGEGTDMILKTRPETRQ